MNSLIYGVPLITFAVANVMAAVAEALVRSGADLDLRDEHGRTARELARGLPNHVASGWESADVLRIVELSGMDPVALRAEREARARSPEATPELRRAMDFARDDAVRLGRREIGPENLLVGLLRAGGPLNQLPGGTGLDVARLRADLGDRLTPFEVDSPAPELSLHPDAQKAMD